MNFVLKECIFLTIFFFCLAFGAYGAIIPPFIQNRAVLTGTTDVTFTCASSRDPKQIAWSMLPLGSGSKRIVISGSDSNFTTYAEPKTSESHLVVKTAGVSTAGLYTCTEETEKTAQLIVITEKPTCSLQLEWQSYHPCDRVTSLGASVKYAANDSLVGANIRCETDDPSQPILRSSSIETHGMIVSYALSQNLEKIHTYASILRYAHRFACNTRFSLTTNDLPDGFVNSTIDYNDVCYPDSELCKHAKPDPTRNGGDSNRSSNGGDSNGSPNAGGSGVQSKSSDDYSGDKSSDDYSGDKSGGRRRGKSGGTSVGLSERHIILNCIVGIANLLLISMRELYN